MLLKHIYMGWKLQRTLKLDISLSLEHFFISVAIFTQVALVSLIMDSKFGSVCKGCHDLTMFNVNISNIANMMLKILIFGVLKTVFFNVLCFSIYKMVDGE